MKMMSRTKSQMMIKSSFEILTVGIYSAHPQDHLCHHPPPPHDHHAGKAAPHLNSFMGQSGSRMGELGGVTDKLTQVHPSSPLSLKFSALLRLLSPFLSSSHCFRYFTTFTSSSSSKPTTIVIVLHNKELKYF